MLISSVVGPLIAASRWLGSLVSKKLFLGTYQRSHEIWAKTHQLGSQWQSCGNYFEYTLYLALMTDPEPRIPKIAIRAKGEVITDLSLIFEADSDTARFQ